MIWEWFAPSSRGATESCYFFSVEHHPVCPGAHRNLRVNERCFETRPLVLLQSLTFFSELQHTEHRSQVRWQIPWFNLCLPSPLHPHWEEIGPRRHWHLGTAHLILCVGANLLSVALMRFVHMVGHVQKKNTVSALFNNLNGENVALSCHMAFVVRNNIHPDGILHFKTKPWVDEQSNSRYLIPQCLVAIVKYRFHLLTHAILCAS